MKHLQTINSPSDVKRLSLEQLEELADDVRQEIISEVANTGGHLATNLGAVEMTLALHYVFDPPTDKLVWDVSHQVYAHKLLTGRRDQFHTLRQYGGLAGFTKRAESEYDAYGAGHASTAISAALGMAAARDNAGQDHKVVAIVGDGSLTGGLAYEGLNNAGTSKKDLLVILNDNNWSISKNVGAMSKYLTSIMSDEKFNRLRNEIWELTGRFKRRDKIRATISHIESSLKGLLVPGMLFQNLGFRYFGPIDGHDLPLVVKTLQRLRNLGGPIILHLATVKGKGFDPAEGDPTSYHGVGKFDKVTGKPAAKSPGFPTYTKVFGDTMLELATKDKRVIAITAAMATGTGLDKFAKEYPERFYDVGIAEGHAGCFAAGLAADGARPYMAVYSTFMQRAYDQIIHDIALQKLPVVFCMDRAGLVGADGPTHHGAFDLSYLAPVPNLDVAVPKDGNEFRAMLHYTIDHDLDGPVAIRYPRMSIPTAMEQSIAAIEWGKWENLTPDASVVLLATGSMVTTALEVRENLAEEVEVAVVNARFIRPLDMDCLEHLKSAADMIVTLEENVHRGGLGQTVGAWLAEQGHSGVFRGLAIPDRFVTHGDRPALLREIGLDTESITEVVAGLARAQAKEGRGFLQKLKLRRNGNHRRGSEARATKVMSRED